MSATQLKYALPQIQRDYLTTICSVVSNIKALIVDQTTSSFISLNLLESELFSLNVFLVQEITTLKREEFENISALYVVAATPENVSMICKELRDPGFKSYHLFFLSEVTPEIIESIGEADVTNSVRHLQRVYFNYWAPTFELFHSNIPLNSRIPEVNTSVTTLLNVCCSIKEFPQIRVQKGSEVCQLIGQTLGNKLKNVGNALTSGSSTVIIYERKEDPVTPLLTNWSYLALMNQILGINANKVIVSDKEYNLSAYYDVFYNKHMHKKFVEVSMKAKSNMESLALKLSTEEQDIEKMYSDLSQTLKNKKAAEMHFSIVSNLASTIRNRNLTAIVELEQKILFKDDPADQAKQIAELFLSSAVTIEDKARLLGLFALKYEGENMQVVSMMMENFKGVQGSSPYLNAINNLLQRMGKDARQTSYVTKQINSTQFFGTTFGQKKITDFLTNEFEPLMQNISEEFLSGRTKDAEFPIIDGHPNPSPKNLVIYIVGGVTYAEASFCEMLKENNQQNNFWVGGTNLINQSQFLESLMN